MRVRPVSLIIALTSGLLLGAIVSVVAGPQSLSASDTVLVAQAPAGTDTTESEGAQPTLPPLPVAPQAGGAPLQPGDVISIAVQGEPTLTGIYYVRPDGMITLPMVGAVPVAGLSPTDAADELALRLRRFILNPHVTVLQLSSTSQVVSIFGAVERPGAYDIRQYSHLLALLAGAGGPTAEADLARTVLVRNSEPVPVVRNPVPGGPVIPMDVALRPGDTVIVPHLRERAVRVFGAVQHPGLIPLEHAETVSRAVYAAGGPTELADVTAVQILRGNDHIDIDLSPLLHPGRSQAAANDVPLELGDIVVVPQLASRAVLVIGAVTSPGPQDAEAVRLASGAVASAGGPTPDGDLSEAYILRGGKRIDLELTPLFAPEYAPSGAEPIDTPVLPGDVVVVPERRPIFVLGAVMAPGAYPAVRARTLSEAVVLAGGLAPDADTTGAHVLRAGKQIPVDLTALLKEGDSAADLPLQPQDAVVVPRRAQMVHVVGQVVNPGTFPLDNAETVADAWALAGGPTPQANARECLLLREGTSIPIDVEALVDSGETAQNIRLQAGDTLIVPRILDEVYVLGAVGDPGAHPIREGDTAIDVLARAGGPTALADVRRIALIRRGEVQQLRERAARVSASPTTTRAETRPERRRSYGPIDPSRYVPTRRSAQTQEGRRPEEIARRIAMGSRGLTLFDLAQVQPDDPAYLVHAGDVIFVPTREMREDLWKRFLDALVWGMTVRMF